MFYIIFNVKIKHGYCPKKKNIRIDSQLFQSHFEQMNWINVLNHTWQKITVCKSFGKTKMNGQVYFCILQFTDKCTFCLRLFWKIVLSYKLLHFTNIWLKHRIFSCCFSCFFINFDILLILNVLGKIEKSINFIWVLNWFIVTGGSLWAVQNSLHAIKIWLYT